MPTMGINVNEQDAPYADLIVTGRKTIETRATSSLRPYLGKVMGIIATGTGKAMLVGEARVCGEIEYTSEQCFRNDEDAHCVAPGSVHDIGKDCIKFGYVLRDAVKYGTPVPVNTRGIVARKIG